MASLNVLEPSKEDLYLDELKTKLSLLKPLGENKLSPQLSELRSSVLDSHADCEEVFENLISKKLYTVASPHRQGLSKTFPEFQKAVRQKILANSTWVKKLLLVSELNIIDDSLFKELKRLNDLRVIFSHSISKKYKIYDDPQRQIWAYELLINCLQKLAIEDDFFGF